MRFLCSLFLVVGVLFGNSVYANLMIAPTRLEVKLEKGQTTESFVVVNQSNDKLKVGIEAISFGANDVSPANEKKTDISKYISINPKVVNLAAGKSRVIRITVRPDQELKKNKGEYYARLLFKTLEKEKREINKKKNGGPKDVAMEVDLLYGTVGDGAPEIKTECFIDKNGPKIRLTNSGLWRFDGNITLFSKNRQSELAKERVMMIRETKREIALKIKPELLKDPVTLELSSIDKKKPVKALNDNCIFTNAAIATVSKGK
jgi:P pilus assembly chaperone PapD